MSGEPTVGVEPDGAAWDRYLSGRPDASAYHAWRWRGVFERAFGHDTLYLSARRDGAIAGVLPLVLFRSRLFGDFIVSLPFVNYGGIVADDAAASDALLQEAERVAAEGRFAHLELRHRDRTCPALVPKRHKVAMVLPLPATADEAWTALDRKVRNQIRKAEKSGLTAIAGGPEHLDEFYRVFARNMRDLGTPVYAHRFFDEVFAANEGHATVVLVRRDRTTVAAGIALTHRDTVEVPWASSLQEFRAACPNHALYWFVVRWAIERGARFLDFGRSTPGEGTFQFKRQWGAEPSLLCWEYRLLHGDALPDQSPKNPKFKFAIEAWKRCPLWLTNTIGPRLVRSIP